MLDGPHDDDTDGLDSEPEHVGLTIPSTPPETARPQRRGWWSGVFADARQFPGEWRLVVTALAESTARQVASDIRSAHRRDPKRNRVRGLAADERWDAHAAPAPRVYSDVEPTSPPYWVWIKFIGESGL